MENKCDCHHKKTYTRCDGLKDFIRYECWGTKERDECSCGGDRIKCDFYPEVREKALREREDNKVRKNSLIEYDFKVGDKVITSTGQTGIIESICDCKYCKERGFCEPQVKTINGVDKIYITDNDKRLDFKSFYQIGDYLFGNIDKESVEYDIENESRKIEEATNNMYTYKRQLRRLNVVEALGIKF